MEHLYCFRSITHKKKKQSKKKKTKNKTKQNKKHTHMKIVNLRVLIILDVMLVQFKRRLM